MADPFVAEIRIFPFNFAPRGWAFCNGQILPISQNTALFSLLGTTYGGNGQTTFALPNLQGRAMVGWGQGPGLSLYALGETAGEPNNTLLTTEMPSHTHAPNGGTAPNPATVLSPQGNVWGVAGTRRVPVSLYKAGASTAAAMNPLALGLAGGSLPHSNMQPYLGLSFIIATQGIFPARN